MSEINKERIHEFLNGHDPMERITSIECDYNDEQVSIIFVNQNGEKRVRLDDFKPFVWAKNSVAVRMFDGDRKLLKTQLNKWGIGVKGLVTKFKEDDNSDRLDNGYKLMFYAKKKMSFRKFLMFFNEAKTPIYNTSKSKNTTQETRTKEFLSVSPVEQYMMSTGKRLFKGYENYDEVKRLLFDIETQGLNPEIHAIDQIGIRTNKGFEKIITVTGVGEERLKNELDAIIEFVQILAQEKPDVIAGHNSENFDWNFIEVRCQVLGTTLKDISLNFFRHPIFKKNKETVLKLGGEVEYYKPTIMWGHNIVDSLHAVRRAQAIDSNMKSASLKYVTKYLKLTKNNRVYVKGDQIGTIWLETEPIYAFNNENGDYYKVSDSKPLQENYELVSGKYIVERYLLDDIWETDKIELKLNESNFLISKILPTTFQRACTMGTAGIWKLILLAWCYENDLAVPAFGNSQRFTGGLSRLLKVGYADNVVKLDFNSLYPSIILTWNVKSKLDISNSMLMMLEYVLTQREKYKELKGECGAKAKKLKAQLETFEGTDEEKRKLISEIQYWESESSANDKKQLPLKILANSFFGSFGAPNIFPFGDVVCAEMTTCVGRMSLRLMISRFTHLQYTPIVGDSVLGDTPLFIKYNDTDLIDIKPISEIIDNSAIKVDELGREYDYSEKNYKVLCRSGWSEVKYVYRHKTDKDIYNVNDGISSVDVTEDHSLFDDNKVKIKPSEINENTKLEYYNNQISTKNDVSVSKSLCELMVKLILNNSLDRIPISILNTTNEMKDYFLETFNKQYNNQELTKTCQAGLLFLKNKY
ncbi:MAG: ribonuclease H-like domain-containing protein [Bacilli bacterium]|nr:ribonuclease H-like domain-containing protein [Bacilli bacterium]